MKSLIAATSSILLLVSFSARAEHGCDEKAEMKRMAEELRKCAVENKAAKLDDCENEAPAPIKAASAKVVELRHKIGSIEEELAAAYDSGDKKAIHNLHKQKTGAEMEYDYLGKEKRAAYVTNNVDELVKSHPASAEAKELQKKTEADIKAYLENARKMIDAQKAQMLLEGSMENVDTKIEIIRKREELKKLESETE